MENHLKRIDEAVIGSALYQGEAAIGILEEGLFQEQWGILLNNCLIKSVFQEPSFVLPWYRYNINDYKPIILTLTKGKKLVGLLTLAQEIDKKNGKGFSRLEGAGTSHALYQTWLVEPEFQISFWQIGIKSLFAAFPGVYVNLKSLPDMIVVQSLLNQGDFRRMSVIEMMQNPVLDYKNGDFTSLLRKRHFKAKHHRLNRTGKVRFEKVRSTETLNQAFNDIEVYYDLRQGAAFNKIQFGNDSRQRELYLEWFKEGILHVSLLWLDENLIGAVIIIHDHNKTAHLAGLITFSPKHGKLSPGLVHLYYLAQLLADEGFHNLKLSPGYDSYKERFCNSHELVFELLISQNLKNIVKRRIRKKVRQGLLKLGRRPMDVVVDISKRKTTIKNRIAFFSRRIKRENRISEKVVEEWSSKVISKKNDLIPGYRRNYLPDLLLVGDFDFKISRWEFLDDAIKRLEDNQSFISLVKDNQLMACIWYKTELNGTVESEEKTKVYISVDFTENDFVL